MNPIYIDADENYTEEVIDEDWEKYHTEEVWDEIYNEIFSETDDELDELYNQSRYGFEESEIEYSSDEDKL